MDSSAASLIDLLCTVRVFHDVTDTLSDGLTRLGMANRVFKEPILPGMRDARVPLIVIGDNFDHPVIDSMGHPEKAILWLTEKSPHNAGPSPNAEKRFADLRREAGRFSAFISYSVAQQAFLKSCGFSNVGLVRWPFALYCRRLCVGKWMDVLFLGDLNARRAAILDRFRDQGIPVQHFTDCFNSEKLLRLNSARIVLNLHYERGSYFEVMRLTDTLSCGAFMLTEEIGVEGLEDGVHLAVADEETIVSRAAYYLAHYAERERIAEEGYRYVRENASGIQSARALIGLLQGYGLIGTRPPAPCVKSVKKAGALRSRVEMLRHADSPKVSVVLVSRRREQPFSGTIESLALQTMQDFEIIGVDAVPGAGLPSPPVGEAGASEAKNRAIAGTRAPFVLCAEAGDYFEPSFLEKALRLCEEKPDTELLGSWYRVTGDGEWYSQTDISALQDIAAGTGISRAFLFRRGVWETLGGFDRRFSGGYEDRDFLLAAAEKGHTLRTLPDYLVSHRIVPAPGADEADCGTVPALFARKHGALFRDNAERFLRAYAGMLCGLREFRVEFERAWNSLSTRFIEAVAYIGKLEEAKAWFLQQLENYTSAVAQLKDEVARKEEVVRNLLEEIAHQRDELARQRDELARQRDELARQQDAIRHLQQTVREREHELRSVYFSKAWKLGCAFKDAKGSPGGALLLPLKLARILFRRG